MINRIINKTNKMRQLKLNRGKREKYQESMIKAPFNN